MANPIDEVQAIGAAKRSPILALPVEVPSVGSPSSLAGGEAPRRVTPVGGEAETQDLVAMTTLREKAQRWMAWGSPVRIRFLVDRESRDVRIRVIDATSGEIIREVPSR